MLPNGVWPFADQNETVLIAGCGTGDQVLTLHDGFGGTAKLTGIDLSRASLGYAAMKAEQFGANDIEFIHMDILSLPELGRTFEVIVACGVLHHMDDPIAAWEMLCQYLVPGGLMNIALYSALARESLSVFEVPDGPVGDDAIRAFRHDFLSAGAEGVTISLDFWNLSGCRDLLFHAKEHRFTLPDIGAALDRFGLEFVGFNLPHERLARIEGRAPGLARSHDFEAWQKYEREYPDTFARMYNFWCRKLPAT